MGRGCNAEIGIILALIWDPLWGGGCRQTGATKVQSVSPGSFPAASVLFRRCSAASHRTVLTSDWTLVHAATARSSPCVRQMDGSQISLRRFRSCGRSWGTSALQGELLGPQVNRRSQRFCRHVVLAVQEWEDALAQCDALSSSSSSQRSLSVLLHLLSTFFFPTSSQTKSLRRCSRCFRRKSVFCRWMSGSFSTRKLNKRKEERNKCRRFFFF